MSLTWTTQNIHHYAQVGPWELHVGPGRWEATYTEGGTVVVADGHCQDANEVRAAAIAGLDRKSTRLNSSHVSESRMPSSA